MKKLPNHTALKEWASVVEAIGAGSQVILIRKGGIADPSFGVEAERFYLFPTFFHQTDATPPEDVTISHWCEAVRTWRVNSLELLLALGGEVALTEDAIRERYRFRPDQAAHVIGIRAFALPAPVRIANRPEYGGCRSWTSIEDEIDIEGSIPVLSAGALDVRFDRVASLIDA